MNNALRSEGIDRYVKVDIPVCYLPGFG
jgi:hypothetical protein